MAKKKKSNKIFYILAGVIILLVAGAVIGKKAGILGKEKPKEVEFAKVSRNTIVEKVSASGTIQPEIEIKITPDVPGEIIQLQVKEGDSVNRGDLLLKIRPDNFQSVLARSQAVLNQQKANFSDAKARLARAEAQLIRFENEYNQNDELYKNNVISKNDYLISRTNYLVAKQDVESAKQIVEASMYMVQSAEASVKEAKENLSLTSVYAPANGIVSKLSIEKGERVVGTSQMAGTEMLRISDLNKMEVRVMVNENDIIRISRGDTAIIDVDAYAHLNKKFVGVVTSIANTAKDKINMDAVTEFQVKIRVLSSSYKDFQKDKSRSPFKPGMTASVEIITNKKDKVLSVPLAAVTTREAKDQLEQAEGKGKEANISSPSPGEVKVEGKEMKSEPKEVVFIKQDGKVKLVEVKTGISDFDNIEILSGLNEDDEIFSGPYIMVSSRLKAGDEVVELKKIEKKF
jgi:HlyD family secretion protein